MDHFWKVFAVVAFGVTAWAAYEMLQYPHELMYRHASEDRVASRVSTPLRNKLLSFRGRLATVNIRDRESAVSGTLSACGESYITLERGSESGGDQDTMIIPLDRVDWVDVMGWTR